MNRRANALVAALVTCLALCITPTLALADNDYSLDQTVIWAEVRQDGTLDVTEERTVDLNGSFHGFFWEIPTGKGQLGDVTLTVTDAGEMGKGGNYVSYTKSEDSEDTTAGVWTLRNENDAQRVDVHFDKSNETARFYVSYKLIGAVARWNDTSELYWKFVGSQWTKESNDVRCYVSFNGSEEGTQIAPGDNLRGWLHNDSAVGEINIPSGTVPAQDKISENSPGTIDITMPVVRAGEFAEVHALFPTEWTPQLEAQNDARLQAVLDEEGAWAKATNERIADATMFADIKQTIYTAVACFDIVAVISAGILYRRSHRSTFNDKYFRDVPTDDHPAVLSYAYTYNAGAGPDFTASLMRLTDTGVITLEKATYYKQRLMRKAKEQQDWLITPNPTAAEKLSDPIDLATYRFVFDYVGGFAQGFGDNNARPNGSVYMADFKTVAETHKTSYQHQLELWKDTVEDAALERGFTEDNDTRHNKIMLIAMAVTFFTVALGFIDTVFISDSSLQISGAFFGVVIRLVVLFVLLVAMGFIAGNMHDRSPEADEIKAKMSALRNWLSDFTKLDEAIPTDVVLWNRLLTMAVVLGVADKVIKQLEVALPSVYEDANLANSVLWCSPGMGSSSPASVFSEGFTSAASESGSGGGASVGGGGGAGGGGGGAY